METTAKSLDQQKEAKLDWELAQDHLRRERSLHADPRRIAALADAAEACRRKYELAMGRDPDATKPKPPAPPKTRQGDIMRQFTTYGPETVAAALVKARAELDAAVAHAPERQIACANAFMRGLTNGDASTLAAQQRERHLRDVVAGLERLSVENDYAAIRAAIDAGAGAIEVGHRTGITDRQAAYGTLHYRRHDLEVRYPDIAARYAAVHQ